MVSSGYHSNECFISYALANEAGRCCANVRSTIQTSEVDHASVGGVPSAPPPDWVLDRRRAIGDHIRAARREVKPRLSQQKLAELAGMDRQAINRIEQGHQAALIDNLIRIADALGVPLSDLVR